VAVSVLEGRVLCLYPDNAALKAFAHVPLQDPRLVQLDKHSALPRVSVCPRIGVQNLAAEALEIQREV